MKNVYHLDLNKKLIENAKIVLLPGDPFRSKIIAEMISKAYNGKIKKLAWKREFCSYLVSINKKNILVTSTGIGGPSTSIAIDELAQLGLTIFLRIGTTGSLQEFINVGDVIITTGSVRLDGASTHYAPIEYPAVAHYEVVTALIEGAKKSNLPYHIGITASSDTFYPGEERTDSFTGYIPRKFQGAMKEWQKLKVLNLEMESSTILTLTSSMGLKGGCITGVINKGIVGTVTKSSLKIGEMNVITSAVASMNLLLSNEFSDFPK